MSWEPVESYFTGKRAPVHISLRRRCTKTGQPRVVVSIDNRIWQRVCVEVGQTVTPLVGSGPDMGKLRLVIPENQDIAVGSVVQRTRGAKNTTSRGVVWMKPWFDTRGKEGISAMPCHYAIGDGYIDVELPREFTDLPMLKVV